MKYRILIDGNLYYPQKKGLFFWHFLKTFVKHPYGYDYIKRKYGYDMNQALEIIEAEGVNTQNRPIQIERK